jgi:hypothetical protein
VKTHEVPQGWEFKTRKTTYIPLNSHQDLMSAGELRKAPDMIIASFGGF